MKLILFIALVVAQLVFSENLSYLTLESKSQFQLRFHSQNGCAGSYVSCAMGCCSIPDSYVIGKKTQSIKTEINANGTKVTRYDGPNCRGSSDYFLWKINSCYRSTNGSPMLHFRGNSYWTSKVALTNLSDKPTLSQ
eukprot:gene10279-2698_t